MHVKTDRTNKQQTCQNRVRGWVHNLFFLVKKLCGWGRKNRFVTKKKTGH